MKIKSFSKKKKVIAMVAVAFVLTLTVAFGIYLVTSNRIPIAKTLYSHVIDINNPRELAGFADYVFVGRVEKQNGVVYENVYDRETEEGFETVGSPYTWYDVTVLENLKGELKINKTIPIPKEGGITMNGKHFILGDGGSMPEVGDVLIIYASAGEDGDLLINGNEKIMESKLTEKAVQKKNSVQIQQAAQAELNSIENSPVYQSILEACENEVPHERDRYTAPAELLE